MFISSAETKYIVPLVTQPVLDDIEANPGNYTILVDQYIKPYLAFTVKYMFYNQLLTETDTFPTSDQQRTAAIQEVLAIMEVSRTLLSDYLNAEIFTTPVSKPVKTIGGFLKSSYATASGPGSSPSSDVTSTLAAASSGIPDEPDTFNFISFATGLLQKISVSDIKAALKSYFDTLYVNPSIESITYRYENVNSGSDYSQFYLFLSPKYNFRIISVAVHSTSDELVFSLAHSESYVEGIDRRELITGVLEFTATGNNTIPINTSLLAIFEGSPIASASVTFTLTIQRL